jgi:hypothetical protein
MPLCRERCELGREVGAWDRCSCPWIQCVPGGVVSFLGVRSCEKMAVVAPS